MDALLEPTSVRPQVGQLRLASDCSGWCTEVPAAELMSVEAIKHGFLPPRNHHQSGLHYSKRLHAVSKFACQDKRNNQA